MCVSLRGSFTKMIRCYAALAFTATTTHFKHALPQDHVEKIPCLIMFLILGLCVGFQGRLEKS